MKEDLIELITKLVFNEQVSVFLTSLCRMCTKDEERNFVLKKTELSFITPELIGLPSFFTLSESSKIRDYYSD